MKNKKHRQDGYVDVDDNDLLFWANALLHWQSKKRGKGGELPPIDHQKSHVDGDTVTLTDITGKVARFRIVQKGPAIHLIREPDNGTSGTSTPACPTPPP